MLIKWQGHDLGNFSGQPRVQEARMIKAELGMLPLEFGEAMNAGDPDAVSMLVAIMQARATGRPVNWRDVEGEFDDFETELTDEELATVNAQLAENGQDPVGKDGKPVPPAAGSNGSLVVVPTEPPLTWTGPSANTHPSSGSTSVSLS